MNVVVMTTCMQANSVVYMSLASTKLGKVMARRITQYQSARHVLMEVATGGMRLRLCDAGSLAVSTLSNK